MNEKIRAAIEALAEQECVKDEEKAMEVELEGGGSTWWYVCPECHGIIDDKYSICKHCGQAVKW